MTGVSQSGYPVITDRADPRILSNPTVPGTRVQLLGGVLAGPVATVLLYFAARFDAEVESLELGAVPDDWGGAPREIRDGTGWSNHASYTAIDLNATGHPQHKRGTFTARQYRAMRTIGNELAAAAGRQVLRLGIDFIDTSVDEMHVEIAPGLYGTGIVERAAHLITNGRLPAVPAQLREEEDEMKATDTLELRDAYVVAAGKAKTPDRTLTVQEAITTGFNYGSVAARDTRTLKGQVTKLSNTVKALQAQVAELTAASK